MKLKLAAIFAVFSNLLLFSSLSGGVFALDKYCTVGNDPKGGVATALGCISTSAEGGGFFGNLMGVAVGLGGGFALLLILYGVFIVTTSAGIPDKLKEGKDIITSAITGLLFIVLSIVLLNLIGVKILAIPGL